jgi:Ala-tRNA(Pro) deacylase
VPDIYQFLDSHGISYQRYDHPPVFTVEDVKRLRQPIDGTQTKNLFLRDEKGRKHFLVVVGHDTQVDLRRLSAAINSSKLSFASPDRLRKHLGIDPGSVSLLALVNDTEHLVEVFLDRGIWNTAALCCHPLVNTATLVVSHEGMEKFLQATGHQYRVIDVPARKEESSQ